MAGDLQWLAVSPYYCLWSAKFLFPFMF